MCFNPIKTWFTKGPFSPLFQAYMRGSTPLPTKISAAAYIASYWAIGCAPPLTLAFYLLQGEWCALLPRLLSLSDGV